MVKASESEACAFHEWENLLREFEALTVSANSVPQLIPQFDELLNEFESRKDEWREEQKLQADNFNILGTMRLTRKELCHSDILAWLLDSKGTHAQGSLGFRLFLKYLGLKEEFADTDYRVIRELSGKESRLDIVVEAEREFIIAIENKIDSEEGKRQTDREWNDLERRKIALAISTDIRAFFLTPNGSQAENIKFDTLSWQQIADIFQIFSEEAQANLVRIFAKHYAEIIRREIVLES